MAERRRPYGRREYGRALVTNALSAPLNLGLLVGVLAVGVLASAPLGLSIGLAAIVYGAASARTLFDEDVAERVLARERGSGHAAEKMLQVSIDGLAPEIRARVEAVREREKRIRDAIGDSIAYREVGSEVDTFVAEAERSARGAQLLHEGLADMPVTEITQRLKTAEADPSQGELAAALRDQLHAAQRIEAQLDGYHADMDRLCVELDTVRAHLLTTSATTGAVHQRQLAGEVRELREEMSAVAAGVEQAYDEAP